MLPSKQPANKFYGGKDTNVLSFELQLVTARYKGQEAMKVTNLVPAELWGYLG
jgi:hypothetical protein